MTKDTTVIDTSTAQGVPTYGVHAYYKYDKSIYTMNIVVDCSSSKYYSSSFNKRSN